MQEKWEERKRGDEITPKGKLKKQENLLRTVPNTCCKLINSQVTPCPKCKKSGVVCSSWHIKKAHQH